MSWRQLFRPSRERTARELEELRARAKPLIHAVRAELDLRDLSIPERRLRYALYCYGVLRAAAREEELDDTHALAALLKVLTEESGLHRQEVSALVGTCAAQADEPEHYSYVEAGKRAMDLWSTGRRSEAVSGLRSLLSD